MVVKVANALKNSEILKFVRGTIALFLCLLHVAVGSVSLHRPYVGWIYR
jgi:hypothetical protein